MGRIWETIMSFGGRQGKECYYILCLAIYVVKQYQPERPQMKVVWTEVCHKAKKKDPRNISKALSRAVRDLWTFGDLERLAAYYTTFGEIRL